MASRTTVFALSTGLAAAAVLAAGPAQADTNADFLSLLSNAGIGYTNASDTAAIGKSVCNMLVEPGKSFASTVAEVRNKGVSPQMASFFAGIAIQAYCPSMLSSIADGSVVNQLNGLNGLSGLSGLNGLAGSSLLSGLTGFKIPGQ
ncbi:hypothetical protein BH11ACT7_BH11ACT7_21570 [soil metagenome]